MPRRPRIVYDNSTVHIMQRGNNRSSCFFADEDYIFYLDQLVQACKANDTALHAYALLPNRINLLLSAADGQAPSRMMKQIGQRYVQYINRTYQRSGTLWEGRFRSCILGEEAYINGCYRYIELSPVRAGLVSQPSDYRWSSFRENTGEISSALVSHAFLQTLKLGNTNSKLAHSQLFSQQDNKLDEEIRSATNGNLVLGSESFQRELGATLAVRTWRGKAGRPRKVVEL